MSHSLAHCPNCGTCMETCGCHHRHSRVFTDEPCPECRLIRAVGRFDWRQQPRSIIRHAYVAGPASGDGPLCGRVSMDADAQWSEQGQNCTYCLADAISESL